MSACAVVPIAISWACIASALALARRPHVAVRAALIVATWFIAVALSFA